MKNLIRKVLAAGLLAGMLAATPGFAQQHRKFVPSEEVLATIPGLTQTQRAAIYRIETERLAEQKALWEAERAAHQAIKEQPAAELRAALGDDAYTTYAAWKMEQRAAHKQNRHHHRDGRGAPTDDDSSTDSETES